MAYIFAVKVAPSSGRSGWILDKSGMLKCFLKSPPEKGKANKELIKTVAKVLGITQDQVVIIAGDTSRLKKIKVACTITFDELLAKLGIERQMTAF